MVTYPRILKESNQKQKSAQEINGTILDLRQCSPAALYGHTMQPRSPWQKATLEIYVSCVESEGTSHTLQKKKQIKNEKVKRFKGLVNEFMREGLL